MGAAVETAERSLTAGQENHSRMLLGRQNLVNVHVGQPFVSRLPALSTVVADYHATDFDARVEPVRRSRVIGKITSARLQLRTGREISACTVNAHPFPTAVLASVNRRGNRPNHDPAVQ